MDRFMDPSLLVVVVRLTVAIMRDLVNILLYSLIPRRRYPKIANLLKLPSFPSHRMPLSLPSSNRINDNSSNVSRLHSLTQKQCRVSHRV